MVYKFVDKKTFGGAIINEIMFNKELAYKYQKFEKLKMHSSFVDNIWGADLADMELISNFNKGFRFLLLLTCIINMHGLSI